MATTRRAGAFLDSLTKQLNESRAAGTYKVERVISSPQGAHIRVEKRSGDLLNFCSNNYLGLSNHPRIVAAAARGLQQYGYGLSSVRFICGTQTIHRALEEELSSFHNTQDCILYGSCFDANAGIFEALLGADDAVVSDALNHASIIDGIRLCKAKEKRRYSHRDHVECGDHLRSLRGNGVGNMIVVTDAAFSMDGTLAPMKELRSLCDQYGALLVADECHSAGMMGTTGAGVGQYMNAQQCVTQGTLGKAMGGATGGYTCGPLEVVQMLRQRSRPYLFSNTLAPSVVEASREAIRLVQGQEGKELREKLQQNTQHFRRGMTNAGFSVGGDPSHPICPIMYGDATLAVKAAEAMLKRNIYVIAFSYPVVPKEKARIRVQLSAAHSKQDIDTAIDAFVQVAKELNMKL